MSAAATAPSAPSRPVRFLTGLALLLFAVAAVSGVVIVSTAVHGAISGDEHVTIHAQVSGDHLRGLPSAAEHPASVDVLLHVENASTKQALLVMARDLAPVILILIGLWQLRGVLISVRRGDPFQPDNVRRLRVLGFLLLVGVPLME